MKKLIVYASAAMLAMAFAGCHGRHYIHKHHHDVPPPVHHGAHAHPAPAPQPAPPPAPKPVAPPARAR
ncbi:MAG: hypothetical protein IJG84_18235 [Kiritimatiellae bacterium]|nr:hypothetical protein [Kiritimatiellia bacterium]